MSGKPKKQDLKPSQLWAIAALKSIGAGIGPVGGAVAVYDLVCRDTYRAHRVSLATAGLGLGLPVSGSFTNDDYVNFRPRRAVSFSDFEGRLASSTSTSVGLYSWSTLKIFDDNDQYLAQMAWSGTGISIPELASGGEGRLEVHYGTGLPVEMPEWHADLQPPRYDDPPKPLELHRMSADSAVITINEHALFEFNKARIDPTATEVLISAMRLIAEHPEYSRIEIEGHTDNVGSKKINQDLSVTRAKAVREWFEYNFHGYSERTWNPKGFGKEKPLVSNSTPKGRAKNRRVELVLWRK